MIAVRDNDPRSINTALLELDRQLTIIKDKLGIKSGDTINNTTNITNITEEVLDPVDVVEADNMNAVTSNAVASAFSNYFKIERLRDADSSTVNSTYSLDTGKKFTDYDFIIPVVTFYGSDHIQTPIIPQAEVQVSINQGKNFIYTAGVTNQARRIAFKIASATTFTITIKEGTSGYLPHCYGFYGIKFGL